MDAYRCAVEGEESCRLAWILRNIPEAQCIPEDDPAPVPPEKRRLKDLALTQSSQTLFWRNRRFNRRKGLLSAKSRRQALSLCLDAVVVVILRIPGQLLLGAFLESSFCR